MVRGVGLVGGGRLGSSGGEVDLIGHARRDGQSREAREMVFKLDRTRGGVRHHQRHGRQPCCYGCPSSGTLWRSQNQ